MSATARVREAAFFVPSIDHEDIDGARHEDIDRARLTRAIWLDTERLGPGRYRVDGGRDQHLADDTRCDCVDALLHRGPCKP